jgi:argininosuccinate lyase
MPQKRNPDAAELVRGKTARVHGDLAALLSLTRALPMAYNRDLQEDREPLFHAVETTLACTGVVSGMWRTLSIEPDRFEDELRGDFSLATEIADSLATSGVPFREAHGVAARIVRHCEERGIGLDRLSSDEAASFHPALASGIGALVDPRAAVERRTSTGGTAWTEVQRQVRALRAALGGDGTAS